MGTMASQHQKNNHNIKVFMRARKTKALQQELLSSTAGAKRSSNFSMTVPIHHIKQRGSKQRGLSGQEMKIIRSFNERRRSEEHRRLSTGGSPASRKSSLGATSTRSSRSYGSPKS